MYGLKKDNYISATILFEDCANINGNTANAAKKLPFAVDDDF